MSDDNTEFIDSRKDQQKTLDVGEEADRTRHREGKTAGSDSFEDTRAPDRDDGKQSQLFADVDDDQATLGGGKAATRCLFSED